MCLWPDGRTLAGFGGPRETGKDREAWAIAADDLRPKGVAYKIGDPAGSAPYVLCFHPEQDLVASVDTDGLIDFYERSTGRPTVSPLGFRKTQIERPDQAWFTASGRRLLIAGQLPGQCGRVIAGYSLKPAANKGRD